MDLGYQTIHSYHLTDAGREYLVHDSFALPAGDSREALFGDRVREFVRRHAALRAPCSVLIAKLKTSGKSVVNCAAQRANALYRSILQETFTPETEIIESPPYFFILLSQDSEREIEGALPEIRQRLDRNFTSPLEVDYQVFGPDEILAFLEEKRNCFLEIKG